MVVGSVYPGSGAARRKRFDWIFLVREHWTAFQAGWFETVTARRRDVLNDWGSVLVWKSTTRPSANNIPL